MPIRTVVDLFSGCGGFALGAEMAKFNVSDSVEIDSDLHYSYKFNFPHANVHLKDLRGVTASYWRGVLKGRRPDGVIGGPPCQGFSSIGRQDKDDVRNQLIDVFFDQVTILRPKFFVMENVKGILKPYALDILERGLTKVHGNYEVIGPVVLQATNFGVPTNRQRVFVIGIDTEEMNSVDVDLIRDTKSHQCYVRDAIQDLPRLVHRSKRSSSFEWGKYRSIDKEPLSNYAALMRGLPRKRLGWEGARHELLNGRVSGNQATSHSSEVKKRFSRTRQGAQESISRYPRLAADGYCPTLRAGTGSDRGSYQAMRPIHPTLPRVISVREAARLQGFPDWFVFHPTIWHSFRMIGNSVPPLMAKSILKTIRSSL